MDEFMEILTWAQLGIHSKPVWPILGFRLLKKKHASFCHSVLGATFF